MAINPPHRLTFLRAPLVANRYGNAQVRDWPNATVVKADVPAWVQPQRGVGKSGSEETVASDTAIELRNAYVFDSVHLESTDRALWQDTGHTFDLTAPPEVWTDNTLANQQLALRRVV